MTIEKESGFAAATRSVAGDDGQNYDSMTIAMHWATAVLVLIQFALSQLWDLFGRPIHHLLVAAHMSFGILLSAVIIVRLIWRLIPGHRIRALNVGWARLGSVTHYILYALLASEAVLGFLLRWSGDEAMSFFGLQLAAPFAKWSRGAHHMVGEFHQWTGWTIVVIAAAHAAAALYHHYVLRDRVLGRMLPWARGRPAAC
jgi:cytochrome b561